MQQILTIPIFLLGILGTSFAQINNIQWLHTITTPANTELSNLYQHGMEVDNNGNITILGTFTSSVTFDNSPALEHGGFGDEDRLMLLRYNSNGDLLWKNAIQDANNFQANVFEGNARIGVDSFGNAVVAGRLKVNMLDLGNGVEVSKSCTGLCEEIFVAKYNNNGVAQWGRVIKAPQGAFHQIAGIDCDANGNIYVAGQSGGQYLEINDEVFEGLKKNQQFILKLNPNGDIVWVNTLETGSGLASCNILRVGHDGAIYVSGNYAGQSLAFGNGVQLPSNGLWHAYIAKYDTEGTPLWARSLLGKSIDLLDINIDANGLLYVACDVEGNIRIDDQPLLTSTSEYNESLLLIDSAHASVAFQVDYNNESLFPVFSTAVKPSGRKFYTAGVFGFDIEIGTTTLSSEGNADIVLVEGDSAATSLNSVSFGGAKVEAIENFQYGSAIDLDRQGYLYLIGYNSNFGVFGNYNLTDAGFFLAKFNTGTVNTHNLPVLKAHISPNPNTGTFQIQLPQWNDHAVCTIADLNGKHLFQQEIMASTTTLTPHLRPGCYLVTVRSRDTIWREKMIVMENGQ